MNPSELRAKRQLLRMSQVALANALGVSSNTIARWERGEMKIARPHVLKSAMKNLVEVEKMSAYDRTMQLAREGNALALALLNACYQFVRENGNDPIFTASWVLGGFPVINFRTLSARGLIVKVNKSRRAVYYKMPETEDIGRALRALGIAASAR